jgi:hypothetical protein
MFAIMMMTMALGTGPDAVSTAPDIARVEDPVGAIAVGASEEMLKPLLLTEKKRLNLDVVARGPIRELTFRKQRIIIALCNGRVISIRKLEQ